MKPLCMFDIDKCQRGCGTQLESITFFIFGQLIEPILSKQQSKKDRKITRNIYFLERKYIKITWLVSLYPHWGQIQFPRVTGFLHFYFIKSVGLKDRQSSVFTNTQIRSFFKVHRNFFLTAICYTYIFARF